MKILLVDDNYDTRTIFRLYFQMAGHSCRVASNGDEAISAAQEESFDTIIMDVLNRPAKIPCPKDSR